MPTVLGKGLANRQERPPPPPATQHHILNNTVVATANLAFFIGVFASFQW